MYTVNTLECIIYSRICYELYYVITFISTVANMKRFYIYIVYNI